MKYITLHSSDLRLPQIGIGCMRISGMSDNELDAFVKTALDHDLTFFDHADIYGGGKSEALFGSFLNRNPGLREKLILQSKCAIHDGMYDFSKEYILKSVDGILERLHTSYLDILLLHRPDALMEPQEVAEAFDLLQQSGKVRQFGVSNMNRYQMELLSSALHQNLCADQLQMSLAHTPMIDAGICVNTEFSDMVLRDAGTLEYCRLNDIAVETWSPLQKGFFGGVFLNDPAYQKLNDRLEELAGKYQTESDAIAYAWLLRYPAKMQVITGTTKPQRLIRAAAACDIELTRKEWYDLYTAAGKRLP